MLDYFINAEQNNLNLLKVTFMHKCGNGFAVSVLFYCFCYPLHNSMIRSNNLSNTVYIYSIVNIIKFAFINARWNKCKLKRTKYASIHNLNVNIKIIPLS